MQEDAAVLITSAAKTDVYTLQLPLDAGKLTALRLETLPHASLPGGGPGFGGGNFVLTKVSAVLTPPQGNRLAGRYVRIAIPGKQKILSLAEVQVFSGADNIAAKGEAKQSSVAFDGPPKLAIDGNTDGDYQKKSTTHTAVSDDPWWALDLGSEQPIDRVAIWNRTDNNLQSRLSDFQIAVLDADRNPVWEQSIKEPPNPSSEYSLSGARPIALASGFADFSQAGFEAANVLNNADPASKGWAVGPELGKPHALTIVPAANIEAEAGSTLTLQLEFNSKHENHTLGHFRVSATSDPRASVFARTPPPILAILKIARESRNEAQAEALAKHYLAIAPELKTARERLESLKKQLAEMKPETTVPVMAELPPDQRRSTRIQFRGNFMDLGDEVKEGVPAAFHPLPGEESPDRLAVAKWLIDPQNPLTARVTVNRYWEHLFGIGIARTSEEFGSQGELPSHPELLDWLAVELMEGGWDLKWLLRTLVTSAAYRQTSRVTPELAERDPDNRLLARGPRVRLSAEMVRDQALAVAGLMSLKMHGASVHPPRPVLGLSAAFGGSTDWQPSAGGDRYRRGLYTEWRRSLPYPSMDAFDAPSREVCTINRSRTNTPLQALVTMNDPVYVEAAQAFARRIVASASTPRERAAFGFRLCLARETASGELDRLVELYESAYAKYAENPEQARKMATEPLGPAAEGADLAELAAWTVVANVLLNLDETLMKR
jgi:hypothetical protein